MHSAIPYSLVMLPNADPLSVTEVSYEAGRAKALTQMVGHMKRCRPALEGQANSNRMDPLALQGAQPVRDFAP